MDKNSLVKAGGVAAGVGATAVGVGIGTIFAGILRDAYRAERATDDGPDDLLARPTVTPTRHTVVGDGGARLNVEVYRPQAEAFRGDEDVVVMVHGWTCNTSYWYPQINHLVGDREVIAYDQRGHGRSERGRTRPSVALLGRDLEAVLTAVVPKGRRAVLVGHSMGGMTIMSWAAQFPEKIAERVSNVVLTSTAAKAVVQNHMLVPVDLPRYTRPFAPVVSRLVTSAPVPVPHTRYGAPLSHYIALGPNARKAHLDFVDEMITACPPRARAGWGSAMGKLDVTTGLEALSVPTTVVVGTADRLTPRTHAEQMAEVLRRNGSLREFVIYDGVGHMSSIEADERFNDLLDAILDEPDAARAALETSAP
ncbi:alpha/beta hydrolase [Gordonia sp. ABSL1-1]|uniref:alpha/beta fold hydrolase n=1 Tax=Gordonia sp. ABSL1-1 TaxID=3053923 RepID=UPI002572D17A|nr:alpha/beta hydrolase [Gordonia sp. ABSL1-1]MDL9936916.1 alpha/beta hydrolase [Gordonia sp. ABSL1-1]